MKEKNLFPVIFSVILMASLFLTACGNSDSGGAPTNGINGSAAPQERSPSPEESAAEEVTIQFWGGWTGPDADTMKGIVEKYMSEHSNVTVELEMQQWTPLFTKFLAEASSGNSPHILAMRPMDMGQFIEMGILNDSFAETIGIAAENYSASAWDGTMYGGRQYAIPLDQHMHGLYYNKDLFEKAGISAPPKTGEEFIEAARKLTLDANGKNPTETGFDSKNIVQYGFAFNMNHHVGFQMSAMINQQGQVPFNADMDEVPFDSEKAVKALSFLQDLVHKYKVTPVGEKSPVDNFVARNVAMFVDGPWQMPTLEATELNWDTTSYPVIFGAQSAWGNSHIFTFPVKKSSDAQQQAVKDFIKWMDQNSGEWAKSGQIPASRDGLEIASALHGRKAFIDSMETMYMLPATPKSAELFGSSATSPFVVAAQSLLLDDKSPEEVVETLRADMNAILAAP